MSHIFYEYDQEPRDVDPTRKVCSVVSGNIENVAIRFLRIMDDMRAIKHHISKDGDRNSRF